MKFKKYFEVYEGSYSGVCFELSYYTDGVVYINWLDKNNFENEQQIEVEIEKKFLIFKQNENNNS